MALKLQKQTESHLPYNFFFFFNFTFKSDKNHILWISEPTSILTNAHVHEIFTSITGFPPVKQTKQQKFECTTQKIIPDEASVPQQTVLQCRHLIHHREAD